MITEQEQDKYFDIDAGKEEEATMDMMYPEGYDPDVDGSAADLDD